MSVNSKMAAIADAIRSKSGETGLLTMDDMAAAIQEFGRSQIIVTAPTGSTVRCSMGGVTKTAAEKNGTWTFQGLDLGVWTVTATLGEKSRTVAVELSRLEIRYIEIQYTLHLYESGDECTDITGGWKTAAKKKSSSANAAAATPSVTKKEGSVLVKLGTTNQSGIYTTVNPVDLTNYSVLALEGTFTVTGSVNLTLYAWTSISTYYGDNVAAQINVPSGGMTGKLELDISQLTGDYIVGFGMNTAQGTPASVDMTACYLE